MGILRLAILAAALTTLLLGGCQGGPSVSTEPALGSVIFIHPDGTGLNTWGACRMLYEGPDGELNWDRLPHVMLYRGHMKDALAATSHGGGTTHAYGVKVPANSFGKHGTQPLVSASGKPFSIMREAQERRLRVGVINSAAVYDAGTGVFLASVDERKDYAGIARQMLEAQPDVMLGGGEKYFLPKGIKGRHGEGAREDSLNLIDRARALGYVVVYTRDELAALPAGTRRVLGLFGAGDTFNDRSEEELREKGLPDYVPTAPTVGEMLAAALKVVGDGPERFFIVCEEEGTDNFAGAANARGTLAALKRADEAIGVALEYQATHRRTLIMTAADSDCGGMQVMGETAADVPHDTPLPPSDPETGSALDGRDGTGTPPFISAPDQFGVRHAFGINWANGDDVSGGVVARASVGAELSGLELGPTLDNTGVYRLMYRVLFGVPPSPATVVKLCTGFEL